jgi:S-DNA-T family DNA segregation ATPase FtsK/SpoIIIE
VEEAEVKKCVSFLKKQIIKNETRGNIREEVVETPKSKVIVPGMSTKDMEDDASEEDVYDRAKRLVIQHQKASTSFLQQMLGVGYPKASKIIYKLEEDGVVGPANGSKSREVYLTQAGEAEE